jgi:alkanesulfonate monooxygenase SsuD/methylene tetrahydromethanopterin reductase-like flavin-dependent oxidoreductase (luciferase family)
VDATADRPGRRDVSIGVAFTPFEDRVEVIERAAVLAENRRFDSIGIAEAMTLDASIVLARLAGLTDHIGLVSGVLSIWGRTPATLALTASELQRASGGRFVLGLGAGTAPIAEGFHGQRWQAPVDRLRETVVAVRALLSGGRLPDVPDGVRALRLGCPPSAPVPIALAAITPPSIRLAGMLADQWLPFLLPVTALADGRDLMATAAAEVGRADAATVTASVPLALARTRDGAGRIAARWLLAYATRMGPVYPRVLREQGYGRELEALLDANVASEPACLPAAAERLARDVLLYGTYDEAPMLCQAWLDRADALTAVAPFGMPAEQIVDSIEAISAAISVTSPVP